MFITQGIVLMSIHDAYSKCCSPLQDGGSVELTSDDLSDNELLSYIRTDEEISAINSHDQCDNQDDQCDDQDDQSDDHDDQGESQPYKDITLHHLMCCCIDSESN